MEKERDKADGKGQKKRAEGVPLVRGRQRCDTMNTVLVVDDAALMRDMIKAILSSGGYEIVGEASDGQEAYDKYKTLKPDITIMDIMMDRVDGIQSLEMIREYDPNAAVVICSAMDQEIYVMKALRLGAKEFIIKPFSRDDVLGAVLRALQ